MNYNNNPYANPYYNPYQQYPYTAQQNYQQPQYQQPQMQQVQTQTNYLPLTFVSGIEGAKAFIVPANSIIYLKDSESNLLFEKKADAQGKYTMTAFELKQIDLNNPNKNNDVQQPQVEYLTKKDLKDYATFEDINKLQIKIQNSLDKVFNRIDNLTDVKSNKYNNSNNNNINKNMKDSD